ncbi:MAG: hypothetical protein EZS28_048467, partial [Streblomastix strix]
QEGSINNSLAVAKTYTDTKVGKEAERAKAEELVFTKQFETVFGNESTKNSLKKTLRDAKIYADDVVVKHEEKTKEELDAIKKSVQDETKRATLSTDNTSGISFTVTPSSDGTKLTGNINLADDSANILVMKNSGLYASVKLSYVPAENKLIFSHSLGEEGYKEEITLSNFSIVKRAMYDREREALILVISVGEGESEVVIPFKDLIEEWVIGRTPNPPFILDKERGYAGGPDVLYADIELSTYNNNILVKLNNSLYVDGSSTNIKHNNEVLYNVVESLKQAITESINTLTGVINNGLSAEKTRAEKAESDELTRATTEENKLSNSIFSATTAFENRIVVEENRAKGAESGLSFEIGSVNTIVTKLNGGQTILGSVEYALATATKHTDDKGLG